MFPQNARSDQVMPECVENADDTNEFSALHVHNTTFSNLKIPRSKSYTSVLFSNFPNNAGYLTTYKV